MSSTVRTHEATGSARLRRRTLEFCIFACAFKLRFFGLPALRPSTAVCHVIRQHRSGSVVAAYCSTPRTSGKRFAQPICGPRTRSTFTGGERMAGDNPRRDDSVGEEVSAFGERAKGAAKDAAGSITGNRRLEREGELENAEGRARQATNDVLDETDGVPGRTVRDTTTPPVRAFRQHDGGSGRDGRAREGRRERSDGVGARARPDRCAKVKSKTPAAARARMPTTRSAARPRRAIARARTSQPGHRAVRQSGTRRSCVPRPHEQARVQGRRHQRRHVR